MTELRKLAIEVQAATVVPLDLPRLVPCNLYVVGYRGQWDKAQQLAAAVLATTEPEPPTTTTQEAAS